MNCHSWDLVLKIVGNLTKLWISCFYLNLVCWATCLGKASPYGYIEHFPVVNTCIQVALFLLPVHHQTVQLQPVVIKDRFSVPWKWFCSDWTFFMIIHVFLSAIVCQSRKLCIAGELVSMLRHCGKKSQSLQSRSVWVCVLGHIYDLYYYHYIMITTDSLTCKPIKCNAKAIGHLVFPTLFCNI